MNLMGHARRVEAAVRVAGFLAARAAAGLEVGQCVVADISAPSRMYSQYRATAHKPKPRPRG